MCFWDEWSCAPLAEMRIKNRSMSNGAFSDERFFLRKNCCDGKAALIDFAVDSEIYVSEDKVSDWTRFWRR